MMLKIALVGVFFCLLTVILKAYKPEYGVLLSITGSVLLLIWLLGYIPKITEYIYTLSEKFSIPLNIIKTLVKCLGILFIAETACDICVDCNEKAMASKIGICAKILMLITALPIFNELITVISGLIK